MPVSHYSRLAQPLIQQITDQQLQSALHEAFLNKNETLDIVDNTFAALAAQRPRRETLRTFMKSWHSTHLKMLPIYGLSCRMIRRGLASSGEQRATYLDAAAYNAETSFEDLNIDRDHDFTHPELFATLAETLCGGNEWVLERYCIAEADSFKRWIYASMVYEPIEGGLFTNLFSEIFNHCEYSLVIPHFQALLTEHMGYSLQEADQMAMYIRAHVLDSVEEDHFHNVVDALTAFNQAEGKPTDDAAAYQQFSDYLERISGVMIRLSEVLQADVHAHA